MQTLSPVAAPAAHDLGYGARPGIFAGWASADNARVSFAVDPTWLIVMADIAYPGLFTGGICRRLRSCRLRSW